MTRRPPRLPLLRRRSGKAHLGWAAHPGCSSRRPADRQTRCRPSNPSGNARRRAARRRRPSRPHYTQLAYIRKLRTLEEEAQSHREEAPVAGAGLIAKRAVDLEAVRDHPEAQAVVIGWRLAMLAEGLEDPVDALPDEARLEAEPPGAAAVTEVAEVRVDHEAVIQE